MKALKMSQKRSPSPAMIEAKRKFCKSPRTEYDQVRSRYAVVIPSEQGSSMQKILGQPFALDVIQRALSSGRLHHAWIFSGGPGVGKFTTAIEFARILLDPNAITNLAGEIEADLHGEGSRLIDSESHPDLHVIRKELALFSENAQLRSKKLMNIPLDVLREKMIGGRMSDGKYREAPAYRTAALGHSKVFIIDEAELIDHNGQNALLKTLEEPPPKTYIFLITSRPERLLATIRSRCQHVRFGSLDEESMHKWMTEADLQVDAEEMSWIENFAEGAPGRALLAAEFGFNRWRKTLGPMIAMLERGRFPATMGKVMSDLVGEFSEAWVKSRKNASKDAANKLGARQILTLLSSYARTRLRESSDDELRANLFADLIDLIREAEDQLERNVSQRHVMDNLVAQWSELTTLQPA